MKKASKLVLRTQTVRPLTTDVLATVRGGGVLPGGTIVQGALQDPLEARSNSDGISCVC